MTERTRNFLIGLTVLVGLVVLGAMIVIFRELPAFLRFGYYDVSVRFPDAAGVTPGVDVLMAGKRVGRVSSVDFVNPANPNEGVSFTLTIEHEVRIPGDANVYIQKGIIGGMSVDIRVDGRPPGSERTDPATGQKLAWIPSSYRVPIEGAREPPAGPAELIPRELVSQAEQAMASIHRLADTLNDFFAPPQAAPVAPGPASTQPAPPPRPHNIHETLTKLDQALDAIYRILGDEQNQANLAAAFANLKTAAVATEEAMQGVKALTADSKQTLGQVSRSVEATATRFQELAAALIVDADKLGNVLAAAQVSMERINSGEGTAAQLLNNPALYNALVDAAEGLRASLANLQDLLRTWRESGVMIKLK